MRCGIGILEYWELTLREILAVIESYKQNEEQRARDSLLLIYQQAVCTADFVTLRFNGKQIPTFDKVFPNVAESKLSKQEKEELKYKKAMFLKEQMEFAARQRNAVIANKNGG